MDMLSFSTILIIMILNFKIARSGMRGPYMSTPESLGVAKLVNACMPPPPLEHTHSHLPQVMCAVVEGSTAFFENDMSTLRPITPSPCLHQAVHARDARTPHNHSPLPWVMRAAVER